MFPVVATRHAAPLCEEEVWNMLERSLRNACRTLIGDSSPDGQTEGETRSESAPLRSDPSMDEGAHKDPSCPRHTDLAQTCSKGQRLRLGMGKVNMWFGARLELLPHSLSQGWMLNDACSTEPEPTLMQLGHTLLSSRVTRAV